MTDLVSRLRTAITARLELARRADGDCAVGGGAWTYEDTDFGPVICIEGETAWSRECNATVWQCEDEADGCPDLARAWRAEARHIAANDPSFVIRACERDLRVLDRHALVCDAGDDECKTCLTDLGVFGDQAVPVAWPCPEIRDLASVYSVEVEA